jgi:hypothetical protein
MTLPRLRFRTVTIPLILLIIVVATACGASGDDDDADIGGAQSGAPAAADRASVPGATTGGTAAQEPAGADAAGVSDLAAQPNWNRLVIRSASVTLAVGDVGQALNAVRDLALGRGGFVFASSSYVEDERQYAQITIQVPADQFDQAMNELRSAPYVEEVEKEESTSQDVSAEFVDNESRLKALRETEARFLDLLGQAETVDDILRLEYELSNVRSQIETIQGRQNYLEQVTSFSTISVSLLPSGAAPPSDRESARGFSFSHVFETAWEHSRGAIEATMIATITTAIFGAAVLPLAVVLFLAWRLLRPRLLARGAAPGGRNP